MLTLEEQAAFVEEAPEIFPADSWRLGKDGPYAHSASGSERGGTDGRAPDDLENCASTRNAKTGPKSPGREARQDNN